MLITRRLTFEDSLLGFRSCNFNFVVLFLGFLSFATLLPKSSSIFVFGKMKGNLCVERAWPHGNISGSPSLRMSETESSGPETCQTQRHDLKIWRPQFEENFTDCSFLTTDASAPGWGGVLVSLDAGFFTNFPDEVGETLSRLLASSASPALPSPATNTTDVLLSWGWNQTGRQKI